MELQKMFYQELDDEGANVICAVNSVQMGGEYTLCGTAIPDTTLEDDGCYHIDPIYKGKLKEVTCPNCLNFILKSGFNTPPLWGVKLGVRGICSPAYAKISRRNLQYPAALRRGFFIYFIKGLK